MLVHATRPVAIAGFWLWAAVAAAQTTTASKPVEIHSETLEGIAEVTAPYQATQPPAGPPEIGNAFAVLKNDKLVRSPQPAPANDLADRLGKALQLGNRTAQFLPDLAAVSNATTSGNSRALRESIVALWRKAGRTPPNAATLDGLVGAVRSANGAVAPLGQHVRLTKPDHTVQIDHSPSAGESRVSVIDTGQDGQPQRTTFSGQQVAQPRADGTGLQSAIKPDSPRQVTKQQADKQRAGLDGVWTDQDGKTWEISGASGGGSMTLVQTVRGGHRVSYSSQWNLGLVSGTHLVNDVADMDEALPLDVREALASQWHPPFTVELEYRPETDELRGSWISGQVTYAGMAHTIKVVDDPTWDSLLVLTRGLKVAQGGRNPEEGP